MSAELLRRVAVARMAKTSEIATRAEHVELASPRDIMNFATELKSLIVENGLYANIKGKNYVNVEGWQIAGAFTGTVPIVERVEDLSQGLNYKYRAEVSLRDKEGNKVGYGVAICTNKEAGKKNFDEYAVASMAQTRAIGKAYRMKIGWLLKIAGYETTPAEEMNAVEGQTVGPEPKVEDETKKSKFSIRDIGIAKSQLERAKSMDELKVIFGTLGNIMAEPQVIAKKDEMKAKLAGSGAETVTATRGGDDGQA